MAALQAHLLNYLFSSTFLFSKAIVEQISTINAIRIFPMSFLGERMRGIVEIISIFCLNPVNVELEQAKIRIDETKDLSP